jgi:hypothetical protein
MYLGQYIKQKTINSETELKAESVYMSYRFIFSTFSTRTSYWLIQAETCSLCYLFVSCVQLSKNIRCNWKYNADVLPQTKNPAAILWSQYFR